MASVAHLVPQPWLGSDEACVAAVPEKVEYNVQDRRQWAACPPQGYLPACRLWAAMGPVGMADSVLLRRSRRPPLPRGKMKGVVRRKAEGHGAPSSLSPPQGSNNPGSHLRWVGEGNDGFRKHSRWVMAPPTSPGTIQRAEL
ncbi:hypothetical protein NDU88_009904 [Pleurodeles waltl]|uniref:Uncharacterized protein n=1 Tax=Pleurodeles waltl TaxID=8319 RepID=A0AAV7PXA5_PLEWA|nr:hypothetical protein NDU88_009904 [Pleurodeles waltl]